MAALYVASAHARERRPTYHVVVTLDPGVAAWARRPIATFHGGTFTPWVLGPEQIPHITREDDARAAPELAVLSALAHGRDPELAAEVGAASLRAAELVARSDEGRGKLYFDAVLDALGGAARQILEAVMRTEGYEYRSEIVREWIREGLEEGRTQGLQEGRQEGRQQGLQEGLQQGRVEGMRELVLHLCGALRIDVSHERRAHLEQMDVPALEALSERIARDHRWPE